MGTFRSMNIPAHPIVTPSLPFQDLPAGSPCPKAETCPRAPGCCPCREELGRTIDEGRIIPFFQPIIDLFSGEVFAYEVFSRAPAPYDNPRLMFCKACEFGLSLDLDYACRAQALQAIAKFQATQPHKKFFLLVDPRLFAGQEFRKGFTLSKIKELQIDQKRVVIEVSEASPDLDHEQFERMVKHYVDQGFSIALDNFGAGHKGLVTLVAAAPNYVKLDYALISEINKKAYKQHLVRSIRGFASNVESILIASGVESVEELETLMRLGVRFAQGYLLGRPMPVPSEADPTVIRTLHCLFDIFNYPRVANDNSIYNITIHPPVMQPGTITCEAMDEFFRADPAIDHVVFANNRQPVGILTRQMFYTSLGGPVQYASVQNKFAEELAKENPLTVHERMEITALGRLAMTRPRDEVYEPVIVVDSTNCLIGTITMKQLLYKFINYEIRIAADSNPLTNLPGNRIIDQWIEQALESPPFTIVYADLDRFKEFNDAYGFAQGDKMIKYAARILCESFPSIGGASQVGHIGGDDFVVVARTLLEEDELAKVCQVFDERKRELFSEEDYNRGYYQAEDRAGRMSNVPLVTVSFAVITSDNLKTRATLEQISQIAASLKKRVKTMNAETHASGFVHDRRTYI